MNDPMRTRSLERGERVAPGTPDHLTMAGARRSMSHSGAPAAPARPRDGARRAPARRRRGARGHRGGRAAPRGHESRSRHSGAGVARCRGDACRRRRGQPDRSGSALRCTWRPREEAASVPVELERAAGAEGRREGGGGLRVELVAAAPGRARPQLLVGLSVRPRPGSTPRCGPTPTAARQGRSPCTAFSCCASRWTRLETKLARLGVELLGPHDDHHKARLPVGSLQAVAALPEVEWVGVSAPSRS